MSKQFFDKDKFYIIRSERAGVFMGKIIESDGTTLQVTSLRRLYKWSGALDVITIASDGVTASGCKFSLQMGDTDLSTIFNVLESHPVSEKALQSINNIPAWTR